MALLVEDSKVWSKWVVDELLVNWLIKVDLRTTNLRLLLILRAGVSDFLGVEGGLVDFLDVFNWLLSDLSLDLGKSIWETLDLLCLNIFVFDKIFDLIKTKMLSVGGECFNLFALFILKANENINILLL